LSETCWATIRREIKNTKSDILGSELKCVEIVAISG
jgi:hypothetical protein